MVSTNKEPRGGRPTKLTSDVQAKVCAAIRKGVHRETAAGVAGVHKATLWAWIDRGEREESGIYREFRDAVLQAESHLELATIEAWQEEGAGSWQSRAEFAARRFRDRWAKQENVKIDATVKVTGARESLLAKLEQMAGADAVDPELALEADDLPGDDVAAPDPAARELGDEFKAGSSLEDED